MRDGKSLKPNSGDEVVRGVAARGAHAAGVQFSAACRKPSPANILTPGTRQEIGNEGLGEPPQPARGPRTLPTSISESGSKAKNSKRRGRATSRKKRALPPVVLGIDLGGTSVKAVVVTPDGRRLAKFNESFDPERRLHFAETIRALVARVTAEHGVAPRAIGLSAPGLAAKDGRSVAHMPGRLAGLEGLVWSDYLGTQHPVPVLNDAQAALLGEVWLGAARGLENVILLTLGTGVGGAAMVDGHLLHGHIGRAGHLGHICLDLDGALDITNLPGSLEDMIGNWTVKKRSRGRFATTHELVAAYEAGDAFASEVWLRSIRALGCAIASFTNILDPEAVVIGGGIARSGRSLLKPLQKVLDEVEWRPGGAKVKLLSAKLGAHAGAYGAARRADIESDIC